MTAAVEVADRPGEMASRYLRIHPGVDTIDCLVAAATWQLGAELWSTDVKHFPTFPQLLRSYG